MNIIDLIFTRHSLEPETCSPPDKSPEVTRRDTPTVKASEAYIPPPHLSMSHFIYKGQQAKSFTLLIESLHYTHSIDGQIRCLEEAR